jgi:hypothetical protein
VSISTKLPVAPHLYAFALTALCSAGAVVLVALGHAVPANLWTLAYAALVGGAGLAPSAPTSSVSLTTTP